MADTSPPLSSDPSTPPSSAAEKARIRKEHREAKIRAGGSARLNKITGLGGGVKRDPPPPPGISVPQPTASYVGDPEEVDISQHFYQPATTSRPRVPQQSEPQLSDEQLRAMMLGFPSSGNPQPPAAAAAPPQPPSTYPNPFVTFPGMEGVGLPGADDPMLKLLEQMMGGIGGMPGMPPAAVTGQDVAGGDPYAYLWRIVHAVFALGLGFYIALTAKFTGTKLARDMSALPATTGGMGLEENSVRFFYVFATAEVVLQSLRFYVEKGTVQPGGILGMVMGFLPQPWKGYLALTMRYGRIWTTTSTDALVCVFVLGVCSWLRCS